MNIIIVGCGKVGYTLAKNLSNETGVNVTIVDDKSASFDKASESIDAMLVRGDGLCVETLLDAGAKDADLLISVTPADETNILCCISAKHLGTKNTVARVRNPDYIFNENKLWHKLGVDMIINPEQETAHEISRLLRFPTVDDIDTFMNGRVELVSFKVTETDNFFIGKSVAEVFYKKKINVLLAMIERNDEALIPNGKLVFEEDDIIRVLGRPSDIMDFFSMFGKKTEKIKDVTIIGGGKITYYLAELLHAHNSNVAVKIIEPDIERCEILSESLPRCQIINGDGTDEDILNSEIIDRSGAIVCLANRDEDNTIIALYSMQLEIRKVILKINHINQNMVKNLGLGSIVSPRNITSDQIIRYVRGIINNESSRSGNKVNNIKAIYRIFSSEDFDETVEALEFIVDRPMDCLNIPLKDLDLKKGILIGCIIRGSNIIIPSGESTIHTGDSVVVIAKNDTLLELDDILED